MSVTQANDASTDAEVPDVELTADAVEQLFEEFSTRPAELRWQQTRDTGTVVVSDGDEKVAVVSMTENGTMNVEVGSSMEDLGMEDRSLTTIDATTSSSESGVMD